MAEMMSDLDLHDCFENGGTELWKKAGTASKLEAARTKHEREKGRKKRRIPTGCCRIYDRVGHPSIHGDTVGAGIENGTILSRYQPINLPDHGDNIQGTTSGRGTSNLFSWTSVSRSTIQQRNIGKLRKWASANQWRTNAAVFGHSYPQPDVVGRGGRVKEILKKIPNDPNHNLIALHR
ncbi:uncharacterized protein LOC143215476 [Lasioglossum baleicum]|uniref:uncharacterized protein LOC143215476 n=1 Tax=Lasioglossum baleicum TaxID=434251 RepID=UPI003FCD74CC